MRCLFLLYPYLVRKGKRVKCYESPYGVFRLLYLLLPEPDPDAVDAELLPGEGVPGMGSGDGSGIAETTESTNGWGCNEIETFQRKAKY